MEDNQTVCPNCGNGASSEPTATVEETTTQTTYESTTTSTKSANAKKYVLIAGVVAVVAIIIAIISSIFGSGWKKPIKNYFKGMEKADSKTYLSAFPEFYADKMEDYYDDDGMADMRDSLEEEYGSNIKISYKITDKEKIKKDDLQKVQKYIKKYYEADVKVSAGYKVKVKATVKGKDDKDTNTRTMYVYKIDGKWGILNTSPSEAKSYLKSNTEDDE